MYRIYYTRPTYNTAHAIDVSNLKLALIFAEELRHDGMLFVSMVSDYHNMVGKSGVTSTDSNYVPQMLNQ